MKKVSIFFLFVSIGINLSAQETLQERPNTDAHPSALQVQNQVTIMEPQGSKPTTISKRGNAPQVTHDEAYYLNEISKIERQIDDLNTKVSIINNDPIEQLNATNSGWFNDMETIKSELEARKSELQGHLN